MKYFYGNSLKEALSNPPVEIKTTWQLIQYEQNYAFVIAASAVEERKEVIE